MTANPLRTTDERHLQQVVAQSLFARGNANGRIAVGRGAMPADETCARNFVRALPAARQSRMPELPFRFLGIEMALYVRRVNASL